MVARPTGDAIGVSWDRVGSGGDGPVVAAVAAGATERPCDTAGSGGATEVVSTLGHENLHDLDVHHAAIVRL